MSDGFVIEALIGDIDGANRDFTTPSTFELGTFRAVVNGRIYPPDDVEWGYEELCNNEIRFAKAPKVGFGLQGIYREPYVEGSPFGPSPIP